MSITYHVCKGAASIFRNFYFTGCSEIINNAAIVIFVAESIQQEVNETVFRDFQHIRCLHLEHTCTNAADVVRCRRTRVVRASKQRYVKIEEGGLFHFRTFIQLCSSNFYLIFMNSPAFFNTGRTAIYTTTTTMVPTIALTRVAPAAQVAMIFAAEDSTPRI